MLTGKSSRRQFLQEAALLLGSAYPLAVWGAQPRSLSKVQPAAVWNVSGPAPHLFFHYMAWFAVQQSATNSNLVWSSWKSNFTNAVHNPNNILSDGLRDIASVGYPLIGPYSSWSPNVVRYHLATAKAAGAQGFIMDWDGPGSVEDSNVLLMLDEAQNLGMKIALMYEEKINFAWPAYRDLKSRSQLVPAVVSDFEDVLNNYTTHPAYLRRNGLPFMMLFNGSGTGTLGPEYLLPAEWEQVMQQISEPISFARQGADTSYSSSTRGNYLWYSFNFDEDMGYNAQAYQMINQGQADFFASMICPRFDDQGVWGWGTSPRITPPEGLSLLNSTFNYSLPCRPELIQVVTWNDFNEGTFMEPSRENGFQYLDALATWWSSLSGSKPDLQAIRTPFLDYVSSCSPAEFSELPAAPYESYMAALSLEVSVPSYLNVLAGEKTGPIIK